MIARPQAPRLAYLPYKPWQVHLGTGGGSPKTGIRLSKLHSRVIQSTSVAASTPREGGAPWGALLRLEPGTAKISHWEPEAMGVATTATSRPLAPRAAAEALLAAVGDGRTGGTRRRDRPAVPPLSPLETNGGGGAAGTEVWVPGQVPAATKAQIQIHLCGVYRDGIKPPPQLTTGRARSQRGVDRHQHLNTGNPSRLQVEPDYSINRRAPGTVPRPLLHASHRESDTSPSRPSLDCASLRPQLFSGLTGILLAANRFASDRSWVYVSWSRGVAN
ncbi:hypothetical protein Purlil1_2054 [Purpureocillium lilacinum]|uniref:Uncharacterized protein n=1 Tax=Purpureocillium lilacinum TaxID=33203 RepID=A0ABR0CBX0_PURLI|nr:hypothetical protein Purlil1_2054 [Purpureocillium lilacinum]